MRLKKIRSWIISSFFLFKRAKWFFQGLVALTICLALISLYNYLTDDFRLVNITHHLPSQIEWNIQYPLPEEEIILKQILAQPYHYLDKGSQSYVFVSQDQNYVLKFFKFKHLKPNWFLEITRKLGLFEKYHAKQIARKKRKIMGVFQSYYLAYTAYRAESGLIFVQLNTNNNPRRDVVIYDKIGLSHKLDLQNYTFILQKKGEVLSQVFDFYLKKGALGQVEQKIAEVFDFYAAQYKKGIYDQDHAVMRNIGFIGDRLIHMDIGLLKRDEKMQQQNLAKADASKIASRMNSWIQKHHPQYSFQLRKVIDHKMQSLFD